MSIPDQRFSIYQAMRSASGDAEALKYKLLRGKSGERWLVAIQPAEADNIYVEGNRGSDGFGGRTIRFPLENGEVVALQGPWKTGADGLLKDTGYDATDKYSSLGIIALECERDWKQGDLYKNVLYKDDDWVIGTFDRIKDMAQGFADSLGVRVVFGVITYGGGCGSYCDPKAKP